MLWRIFFLILLSNSLLAEIIAPIERQSYCNYQIDYFGNIYMSDGMPYQSISEDKIKSIQNDCWDPVFKKKYFVEAALKYKYNTTHYYLADNFFNSTRTPINFDFTVNVFRKYKNKILLNGGAELFYSFPLPDLDYTNNLSAIYGTKFHLGAMYPTQIGNFYANIGAGHLIVAKELLATEYTFERRVLPFVSIEFQKRYQSFIGFVGLQSFVSSKGIGTEQSAWLKFRYEPPTEKIQVTLSPFYRYSRQYFEQITGITQHFGLELGYRF